MSGISRRELILSAALAGASGWSIHPVAARAQAGGRGKSGTVRDAEITWLDGAPPQLHEGQTWGVPWPVGSTPRRTRFAASDSAGRPVPLQTWVTATWPDGSIKWTAHAIPAQSGVDTQLRIARGRAAPPKDGMSVRQDGNSIEVSSGAMRWRIGKSGQAIIQSASNNGRETLGAVRLIALIQDGPEPEASGTVARREYRSEITGATVEQDGPVRAVVKVDGWHSGEGRSWLPFSMRLYFYAGSEALRIVHSFIFDGDEQKDFIAGLGLVGEVPMEDLPYDRHVRFAGAEDGLWGEAIQPLTGLRRDPGNAFREAQVAGLKVPPIEDITEAVARGLRYIPQWGDFSLAQNTPDGFTISKRTKSGHGWIEAESGGRANGLGYIGGASGGVAFGLADFWQRFPVQLDIRSARTDTASFTLWYRSPSAPPMDLRFYHDGLEMTDHVAENEGLDITYEDYERGWGTPYGIARTTEFTLWCLPSTPSRSRFSQMSAMVARPPRLVTTSSRIHAAGVFGDWSLPDRSTPARNAIEEQNEYLIDFYQRQIEQRRWYGFWHYGDIMHTYDRDRHVWRYDIGGFAWDNSELSPDLWLWYSFLRSGDAGTFRMAEAMTRHTGEVDVYHIGKFRGLGTRHSVQHWGDSSKQPRVSTAAYRRIFYYLTADERVGDLMHALLDSDRSLVAADIYRKVTARRRDPTQPAEAEPERPPEGQVFVQFGTSWSSLASAWLTEWERTGNRKWRDRIVAGMSSIAALPKQWFAGGANYDLASGRFVGPGNEVSVSHLNAVFGAVEIHSELLELIDLPAYREAWLDYCAYYNASAEEFGARVGAGVRGRNLQEGHSRLTAYAAKHRRDPRLARRSWQEFFSGEAGLGMGVAKRHRRIGGPDVLKPIDESPAVSTNATAQWGLAAIQNLALVGEFLDAAAPPDF